MSRIYADIIVDISQEKLDKSFQYEIPEELQGQVEIGKRVRIPFGNGGRELTGYVIGLSEEPKIEPDRIKAILAVEDRGMEIESRLISLAGWIARQYGSTMNQALKTVLPVKEKETAKEKRYLCLAAPEEACIPFLEEYRRKHYKAKERLLQALMEKKTLEYTYAAAELKITASVIRGRIHTYEQFLESYEMARKAGFTNINIDLISAIPKQTVRSWEETLKRIIRLKPEHISAYSLIIEKGTSFAKLYGEGSPLERDLPSEEEERLMYEKTEEILDQNGYHRYEISNYAKEGMECRHNLGYWERKNYLGLGLGASSLLDNRRYSNTENLREYTECAGQPEKIRKNTEHLTEEEQMEEFIFLGLRKMNGISEQAFWNCFQKTIWDCYGENIRKVMEKGLLKQREGCLSLTKKGIDVSNYVFAEILYQ